MILECKNLSIGYDNRTVMTSINLTIEKGEYVCIFGDNGSGKSTLVKTLLGLSPKLKGEIIYGEKLTGKSIGYLPQKNDNLANFPASVYEVVRSGCLSKMGFRPFYTKPFIKKTKEMLKLLEIDDLEQRSFAELSGGQQQRVLLARALCATDKLIILDEPFTGLDQSSAKKLYETLHRINKEIGVTILIVSHYIEDALKYADKVVHLNQDCLFCGNPEEYKVHLKKEYTKKEFKLDRHSLLKDGDE